MDNRLDKTLSAIGDAFADKISPSSRHYLEVDIGTKATDLGFSEIGKRYRRVLAIVPVRQAQKGMKVRIDGRTFVNYGQLESGVVIPGHVVRHSGLPHARYIPSLGRFWISSSGKRCTQRRKVVVSLRMKVSSEARSISVSSEHTLMPPALPRAPEWI